MAGIAAAAGISAETLRKIETGRAPTPAFSTVAAPAEVLGLSMDTLVGQCAPAVVQALSPGSRRPLVGPAANRSRAGIA